jgi:undecaprenyl-phosphate 4-deoxy-4-formamido-L-arabinose transferase
VASLVGFTFTAVGGMLLLYILGRYLIQGVKVPGFVFLGSAISLLSGAQLFALGIIGEYLARMYSRMLDRPAYTVSERFSAAVRSEEVLSAFPENE